MVEQTQVLQGFSDSAKRPDILILDTDIPPVIIEASYSGADADKDAIARLGLLPRGSLIPIRTTIAVRIPPEFRSRDHLSSLRYLENDGDIEYAVHQVTSIDFDQEKPDCEKRRWPKNGFVSGGVHDLADLIQGVALPKEQLERLALEIADLLDEAAYSISRQLKSREIEEISEVMFQRTPISALRTCMVVWLNALMLQHRLAKLDVKGAIALDFSTLSRSLGDSQVFLNNWVQLNKKNWNSILEPAVTTLQVLANMVPRESSLALTSLVRAVKMIEEARVGLDINVGAELFPKLSEDRKEAAAYYTQAASAELLTRLAIRAPDLPEEEWQSEQLFANHSMVDLACGTGTLLRSGFRRAFNLHKRASNGVQDRTELYVNAMEHGLVGTDINPIAAHLTASSLAMLGDGSSYRMSRVGWLGVGGPENAVGSLEFFDQNEILDQMRILSLSGRSVGRGQDASSISVIDGQQDWILMNPPYSRTRGGQSAFDVAGLSVQERNDCQFRWRDLVRSEPVTRTAGLAASFLALAKRKIKPGGKIGFVLPLTAAFAESWRKTRKMIEESFIDVLLITHAAGEALDRSAISADTNMEEMLLVATRRKDGGSIAAKTEIYCATLLEPTTRCGEAGEVARAIEFAMSKLHEQEPWIPILIGGDEIGRIGTFAVEHDGSPWSNVGVVHSGLADSAMQLIEGRVQALRHSERLSLPMTTLDEVAKIGPTHHLIGYLNGGQPRGAFEFYKVKDVVDALGSDSSLWHAQADSQRQLIVVPTHKGFLQRDSDEDEANRMRDWQSTLFYSRNMRWTSQSLLTASTEQPVLGGRTWTALINEDQRVLKALALWCNSTFGFIAHWTVGQRTQAGRSTTQINALKNVPCPNFNKLSKDSLDLAAKRFTELSSATFLPACQAHIDPARIALDEALIEILGLSDTSKQTLETMRILWCHEPSVHAWNRAAKGHLKQ